VAARNVKDGHQGHAACMRNQGPEERLGLGDGQENKMPETWRPEAWRRYESELIVSAVLMCRVRPAGLAGCDTGRVDGAARLVCRIRVRVGPAGLAPSDDDS
jgi:hypothetical protein